MSDIYCPIRPTMGTCVSNCAFRDGKNCLIAEALKTYSMINKPIMSSFYINEKGDTNPREAE